jgi:hypothetical protein
VKDFTDVYSSFMEYKMLKMHIQSNEKATVHVRDDCFEFSALEKEKTHQGG